MFVAWKVGEPVTMMQYIRKTMLQYQKEWLNGLTLTTWARNENNEAAGTLRYDRYNADGTLTNLKSFTNTELGAQLRFAPGERAYNGREGKNSLFNLSKDAPVFKLSHQMGLKNVLGATSTTTIRRSAPRNGSGSLPSDISTLGDGGQGMGQGSFPLAHHAEYQPVHHDPAASLQHDACAGVRKRPVCFVLLHVLYEGMDLKPYSRREVATFA